MMYNLLACTNIPWLAKDGGHIQGCQLTSVKLLAKTFSYQNIPMIAIRTIYSPFYHLVIIQEDDLRLHQRCRDPLHVDSGGDGGLL